MRLSRFFTDQPLSLGLHVLSQDHAHYIGRVLRYTSGDKLQLFNGNGYEFIGHIIEINKKSISILLETESMGLPDTSFKIHLGQAVSRGERMDWVIQKATELGVTELTPLITERCEVRMNAERAEKRITHWRKIAISACEQSGRSIVPIIHPILSLDAWSKQVSAQLKLVLQPSTNRLTDHLRPDTLALLIGPEGGLSSQEIVAAKQADFHTVCFGPRVLRTETAPIVALSIAQQLWGDF
ncbi:UNVERIFIED_CONTAM: hypothetical protein GTU68_052138 [Idotea baltica]|nr:hypothetical protein [Idotea baltica]